MDPLALLILLALWVLASSGSGWVLAILAKRLHPGLSRNKLWVFYTALSALLAAIVLIILWA